MDGRHEEAATPIGPCGMEARGQSERLLIALREGLDAGVRERGLPGREPKGALGTWPQGGLEFLDGPGRAKPDILEPIHRTHLPPEGDEVVQGRGGHGHHLDGPVSNGIQDGPEVFGATGVGDFLNHRHAVPTGMVGGAVARGSGEERILAEDEDAGASGLDRQLHDPIQEALGGWQEHEEALVALLPDRRGGGKGGDLDLAQGLGDGSHSGGQRGTVGAQNEVHRLLCDEVLVQGDRLLGVRCVILNEESNRATQDTPGLVDHVLAEQVPVTGCRPLGGQGSRERQGGANTDGVTLRREDRFGGTGGLGGCGHKRCHGHGGESGGCRRGACRPQRPSGLPGFPYHTRLQLGEKTRSWVRTGFSARKVSR